MKMQESYRRALLDRERLEMESSRQMYPAEKIVDESVMEEVERKKEREEEDDVLRGIKKRLRSNLREKVTVEED